MTISSIKVEQSFQLLKNCIDPFYGSEMEIMYNIRHMTNIRWGGCDYLSTIEVKEVFKKLKKMVDEEAELEALKKFKHWRK